MHENILVLDRKIVQVPTKNDWSRLLQERYLSIFSSQYHISTGQISKNPNSMYYTGPANPCNAGILYPNGQPGMIVWHSFAEELTDEFTQLIKNGSIASGFAGGPEETYNKLNRSGLLSEAKIEYVRSDKPQSKTFYCLSEPASMTAYYFYE